MAANERALKPGDVLAGKYVLREYIGEGGMGVVFLADHPTLARRVAVKVLHPYLAAQASYARRFRDEALAARRVQHHGSVEVIDFDVTADGTPFMAMKIAPGRSLAQLMDDEPISVSRALGIVDQLLGALDAVHACAVVHADVKSENVIIEERPDGDAITLIDYGLAQLDGAVADPGVVAGTPEYMAPELVCGRPPSIASDLYAVGVILYELLTGTTPFSGEPPCEILRRQVEDAVVPPSRRRPGRGLPEALDRIVLRALDKDPGARFATAQELRDALGAIAPLGRDARPRRRPAHSGAAPVRRRLARGSDASGADRLELRRAIAIALASGDLDEATTGYIDLAAALTRELRLGAAICELEEAIDTVTTSGAGSCAEGRESIDRLATSLAALYDLAGEPSRMGEGTVVRATLVELA